MTNMNAAEREALKRCYTVFLEGFCPADEYLICLHGRHTPTEDQMDSIKVRKHTNCVRD